MTHHSSKGFTALVSVLLIGALAFLIAVGMLINSLAAVEDGVSGEASVQARLSAEACAEYALFKLRQDPVYIGNESYQIIPPHSCSIGPVTENASATRSFLVQNSDGDYVRQFAVVVELSASSTRVLEWTLVP